MTETEGAARGEPLFSAPIAFVTLIDPRDEFFENFLSAKGADLKEQFLLAHQSLKESLAGEDLVDLGVVDRREKAYRAAEKAVESDSGGLIINLPGWAPPGWGGVMSERTGQPILINAPFALSGPMAMRGELEALGADYEISLGEAEKIEQFVNRVKAGKLLSSLRGKRFGSVGGLCMDMHYAEIASAQALLEFGLEVVHLDGAGIISRAETVSPGRLDAFTSRFKEAAAEFPIDSTGILKRQLSFYLALKDILEEEGVDFASVKCQPEFSDIHGALCFAPAFLPLSRDLENDKKMIPMSCEGDFFASLAGYLLMLLSGAPPLFADFIMPLFEEGLLALQNCGGAPPCYAGGGADPAKNLGGVRVVPNVQGASGSYCMDFMTKDIEHVTLLGMGRRRSSYWAGCHRGEVVKREDLKPLLMDWPTLFLKVEDARACLRHFYTQHVSLVPGDHVSVLEELKALVEGRNSDG